MQIQEHEIFYIDSKHKQKHREKFSETWSKAAVFKRWFYHFLLSSCWWLQYYIQHIHLSSCLAALLSTGALTQRCWQSRVVHVARVGSSGAPALRAEFQHAALDEGAVRLTLRRTRLHLSTRYSVAVIRPGQSGAVWTETLRQTHHPDFIGWWERHRGSQQSEGRRRGNSWRRERGE